MSEYECDRCRDHLPDGDGIYVGNDRVCAECNNQQIEKGNQ